MIYSRNQTAEMNGYKFLAPKGTIESVSPSQTNHEKIHSTEARQLIGYEFAVFKVAIDDLPASQIKQIADDCKERIAWELWAGTVSLNVEIQDILTFWDFLDSQIVPAGLSPVDQVFYRRTAKRMVRGGFLSRSVLQQFTKPKCVRTPPSTGKGKLILSQAA